MRRCKDIVVYRCIIWIVSFLYIFLLDHVAQVVNKCSNCGKASEQIRRRQNPAVMARHMLRRLENLSVSELAELSAEVSAEHQRRASEVWGVAPSEPTPEPAPNVVAAEIDRRKVVRCDVYLTEDSRTWHCDSSCEEIRAHPRVQQRTVRTIMDAGVLYVADWLAELQIGPCSLCTSTIWEMVLRQHPGITDPELQRFVQSSSSGSGIPSTSLGSSVRLALEGTEMY